MHSDVFTLNNLKGPRAYINVTIVRTRSNLAQPCTHEVKNQPRAYSGHLYAQGRSPPRVYSRFLVSCFV